MQEIKSSWSGREVAGHLVFLMIFFGTWEYACARGWLDPTFFGRPSEIVEFLYEGFVVHSNLWLDLGYTLLGTGVSFLQNEGTVGGEWRGGMTPLSGALCQRQLAA